MEVLLRLAVKKESLIDPVGCYIQIWSMLFRTIRRDAKFVVERPPGEGPVPSLGGEEIFEPSICWCMQIWRMLCRTRRRDAKYVVERQPGEGRVSYLGADETCTHRNGR